LRQKGPQRDGGRIDTVFFESEDDVVLIESVLDRLFAEYVREGQAVRLQHGAENQPKSLREKSSSLIE
jgi:hypothetical protein